MKQWYEEKFQKLIENYFVFKALSESALPPFLRNLAGPLSTTSASPTGSPRRYSEGDVGDEEFDEEEEDDDRYEDDIMDEAQDLTLRSDNNRNNDRIDAQIRENSNISNKSDDKKGLNLEISVNNINNNNKSENNC